MLTKPIKETWIGINKFELYSSLKGCSGGGGGEWANIN